MDYDAHVAPMPSGQPSPIWTGMTLTVEQDPILLQWVNDKLGTYLDPLMCRWVAGLDQNGVIFVVVYSRFSQRNCDLTIATDGTRRWATRRALRLIAAQPFKTWGLARVSFYVRASNHRTIKMLTRLGATQEGRLRRYFGDAESDDALVFGVLEKENRYG